MSNSLTPLTEVLRAEIATGGPILFSRFMDVALYHPRHGYYRRERDPFGRRGDFFTAEQIQPVFGRIVAGYVAGLMPAGVRTVVELGAGRREMAPHLTGFEYVPVDVGLGALPSGFAGVLFANEFFDALPVDVVVNRCGALRLRRVEWAHDRFSWVDAEPAPEVAKAFVAEAAAALGEGESIEVNLAALAWIDRIAASMTAGHVLIIDYGYTRRESVRFPQGTLMSYHRHHAADDVLADPGDRDITAHVAFSAIEAQARRSGLEPLRFESMASMLLRAGEPDQFAAALAAPGEREAHRLRLQLKTLLFGMGETFRTLLLKR